MTMTHVRNEATGIIEPPDNYDSLPEFYRYEDNGCEASDACLDCPLPRCKHDDPAWYQRNRRLAKDFQMMYTIQQERLSVEEAAERFSVTARTVFRILQRCREALAEPEGQPMGALAA